MEKIVFNVEEMAQILGVKPLTIYRSVQKGKLPAVKIGKNILFPKEVMLQWLKTKAWEGYKEKTKTDEAKEEPFVLKKCPTGHLGIINEELITREAIYGDYLSDRF
ncbi:MAG: helix-turn-helix domain-containing protein [bacterium]